MAGVASSPRPSSDEVQAALIWAQEHNDAARVEQLVAELPAKQRRRRYSPCKPGPKSPWRCSAREWPAVPRATRRRCARRCSPWRPSRTRPARAASRWRRR